MKRKHSKARPKPVGGVFFHCPCCVHDTSVRCYMFLDYGIGEVACRMCDARYSTTINKRSILNSIAGATKPIDIYEEWLEECKENGNVDVNPWKQLANLKLDGQAKASKRFEELEEEDSDDDYPPLKKLARMKLH